MPLTSRGKRGLMRSSKYKENTRVLFSPRGYIAKEIVHIIRAANQEIVAAIYLLSSKYVAKALSKAVERGVSVRLVLDRDQADKYYSVDEWMIERGIQIRIVKVVKGLMHHKFLIIDKTILVTGSYNITSDAEYRNHEAMIFTADQDLILAFHARFELLWEKAADKIDHRYKDDPAYHYHKLPSGKAYWHPKSYEHRKPAK